MLKNKLAICCIQGDGQAWEKQLLFGIINPNDLCFKERKEDAVKELQSDVRKRVAETLA